MANITNNSNERLQVVMSIEVAMLQRSQNRANSNQQQSQHNQTSSMKTNQNILLIGATGGTGIELLQQLNDHPSLPKVHALVRNANKIGVNANLCASVIQGDALNTTDIINALRQSQADTVIVSIGNGPKDVSKTELRTKSAKALVRALSISEFKHVQVLCVSSIGAGNSRINVGMGMGKLISFYIRHIIADHTGQEAALASIQNRTTIVRPTGLTVDKPVGHVVAFGDRAKAPTMETDRVDLAAWIVEQVCESDEPLGNNVVNITGVKQ